MNASSPIISLQEWARECEQRRRARRRLSPTARIARSIRMMDGAFYLDSRAPFISVDIPLVTLATTDKALYRVSDFPILGGNYFNFVGKAILIRLFGRITTVLTPGNGSFSVYFNNGTDAAATLLQSSAALALTASQTSVSWWAEFVVRCRAIGPATIGSLFATGIAHFNVGVLASTLQPMMIPAATPAAVTVDLTLANIISVQFKRSGSTAETMQVHEMAVVALN